MSLGFELTSSEKITMLLDGELHNSELGSVFFDVAKDENLQEEFLSQLQIRKLMRPAAIIPADTLRLGIISSLGLGGTIGFWGRFAETGGMLASSKVFLMLLASTITGLGTYFYMNNEQQSKPLISQVANSQNNQVSSSNLPNVNNFQTNVNQNTNFGNSFRNSQNAKIPISRSSEANIVSENNNNIVIAEKTINTDNTEKINSTIITPNATLENSNLVEKQNVVPNPTIQNHNEIVPNGNILKLKNNFEESRFVVTFRGFASQRVGNINLSPESSPSINNVAIGTMFEFSKNFSAGFEFGQENFVQQFKASAGADEIDLIQNKLAFWGGINLSYKLDKQSSIAGLQPYATLFLGGTNFGYITRQTLGLNYEINSQFAMFTGFEYTSLFSSYNNIWNTSKKYGMTYGVQLRF